METRGGNAESDRKRKKGQPVNVVTKTARDRIEIRPTVIMLALCVKNSP